MRDVQTVTVYYHAAYAIAALIYGSYVLSLIVRARRVRSRIVGSNRG